MNKKDKALVAIAIGSGLAALIGIGIYAYEHPPKITVPHIPARTQIRSMAQTGGYVVNFSNCSCVQGYGGNLTLAECQSRITQCQQIHNAQIIY